MRRHDRSRFFAFGVLSALNGIALLLHALGISTSGDIGDNDIFPVLFSLAGLWLLLALISAVMRGHDMGWTALTTFAAFVLSFGVIVAFPVLLFYFSWVKGQPAVNVYGPPPARMRWHSWLLASVLLVTPWVLLWVAANFYR